MKAGFGTGPGWWRLAVAVPVALLAVACGAGGASSGGTPGASATPTAVSPVASPQDSVLCTDVAALRASLDKLTHVRVSAGTVDEITTKLNEIMANLATLVSDARDQWQAQTSALNSALSTLKTAVANLAASPSSGAAAGVVTALGRVNAAARNLLAAVDTRCLSASPTPSM
jgi:hypothetical protein